MSAGITVRFGEFLMDCLGCDVEIVVSVGPLKRWTEIDEAVEDASAISHGWKDGFCKECQVKQEAAQAADARMRDEKACLTP